MLLPSSAAERCPFLHHMVHSGGGVPASLWVGLRPSTDSASSAPPYSASLGDDLEVAVQRIHGPQGAVPLQRFAGGDGATAPARCPVSHASAAPDMQLACCSPVNSTTLDACPAVGTGNKATAPPVFEDQRAATMVALPQRRLAPAASMSLAGGFGFLPDPGEFFRRRRLRRRQGNQQRQGKQRRPSQRAGSGHPPPGPEPAGPAAAASSSLGGASGSASSHASSGQCPMRAMFGPLAALAPLSANGRLQCPPVITRMRAAVAALKPVRDLRPRGLPVRALALMAAAVAANVPCGAWREHTRKFSPQWFLAVHATIPFVAMLRKAVLMPQWALALTVAGAVAGQGLGARLERRRLAAGAHRQPRAGDGGSLPASKAEGLAVEGTADPPQTAVA